MFLFCVVLFGYVCLRVLGRGMRASEAILVEVTAFEAQGLAIPAWGLTGAECLASVVYTPLSTVARACFLCSCVTCTWTMAWNVGLGHYLAATHRNHFWGDHGRSWGSSPSALRMTGVKESRDVIADKAMLELDIKCFSLLLFDFFQQLRYMVHYLLKKS